MITQKKAQISIQFNWLFVLIVGGIIIFFFITLISSRTKIASTEEANDLVHNLDTVFTTIKTDTDSSEEHSIHKAELELVCSYDPYGRVYDTHLCVQNLCPIDIRPDAMFGPNRIYGDKVYTWTKKWQLPFDVTTMIYLASERTLFVFVGTEPNIETLYEEFDDHTLYKKTRVSLINQLDVSGFDRYVIISAVPVDYNDIKSSLQSKSHVRIISNLEESGTVGFQGPDDNSVRPAEYYTRALLWGAIFAEDAPTYECTRQKALDRLYIVARLLETRADLLVHHYADAGLEDGHCYNRFYDAWLLFGQYKDVAEQSWSGYPINDFIDLNDNKDTLDNLFKEALRGFTCPELY